MNPTFANQPRPSGSLFFKLMTWLAFCFVLTFVINMMISGGGDEDSIPDVPVTNSLLIVYESDPSDASNTITLDQRFIIDSTKIRSWCQSNGVDFLAIDKDQAGDLQFVDDKWQELVNAIGNQPLPAWAISFGRTTTAGPLPPSVDDALQKLEGR
jgi:hypothetical protein